MTRPQFAKHFYCRHAVRLAVGIGMLCGPGAGFAADPDRAAIRAEVVRQHDASIKRLQDWIALPSIAAENLNSREGVEYMAQLARDAGFQHVEVIQTDASRACTQPIATHGQH